MSQKNNALMSACINHFASKKMPTPFQMEIRKRFSFLGEDIVSSVEDRALHYKKEGQTEKTIILGLSGLLRQSFAEDFAREDRKIEAKKGLSSLDRQNLFASDKGVNIYIDGIIIVNEFVEDDSSFTEVFYGVSSIKNNVELTLGDWYDDSYAGEVRVKIYSDNREVVEFMPY